MNKTGAALAVAAYAPAIAAGFTSGRTAIVAYAEGGVAYRTWDDEAKKLVDAETSTDYTEVAAGMTAWGTANTETWYVVNTDTEIATRITVTGDVRLILCDGTTLAATEGIAVNEGNSLTIYAQEESSGELEANLGCDENSYWAGIGSEEGENCGTVTINGGTVYAGSYNGGTGIGAGDNNANLPNGDLILGKGIQLFGGADPDATTEVPFVNSDYARSPVMKASFPVLASNTIIRFDDDGEYYFTPYTLDSYLFMKDASGTSFSQTNNCFRIEDDELVYYRDNKKVGVVADIPDYFTGTASVSISGSFFVIHPNSYYFSDLIDTEALNLGDVLTPGVTGQFDSIQVDGNSTVYTNANIEVTNKGLFDTNETTATPIDRIYESDKAYLITSESTYGSNYTLEQIDFALPAITMPLQQ